MALNPTTQNSNVLGKSAVIPSLKLRYVRKVGLNHDHHHPGKTAHFEP
jgi:hypothetical protein